MIRELFFPPVLGGRPLFPEKVVGITISGETVQIARVTQKRSGALITATEEFVIPEGEAKTHAQRLSTVLKRIAPTITADTHVRVSYPSAKVITKEITVPFLEREKICKVVEYEVEPSIPFNLDNAVVDFIIMHQSEVKQSSTILVVAAQLDEVKKHLELFEKAGLPVHSLTIDAFALAGLCLYLPSVTKLKHEYALIDVGTDSSRVSIANKQSLIAIRTIAHEPIKTAAQAKSLRSEIQFTLTSFNVKREEAISIEKLFYCGNNDLFGNIGTSLGETLGLPCEIVPTEELVAQTTIKSKAGLLQPDAWQKYTHALGAAFTHEPYTDFTLRQKEIAFSVRPQLYRQFVTAGILLALLIGGLATIGYLDLREVDKAIATLEAKETAKLRRVFSENDTKRKKGSLQQLAKDAAAHVQEQETIWAPFAKQRLRPLEVLQELSQLFNRKKYTLSIDQVAINGNEQEQHPIEIIGSFKSKTGSDHFKNFSALEEDVRLSKTLMLTEEIDPKSAPDGLKFTAHFKQKEDV